MELGAFALEHRMSVRADAVDPRAGRPHSSAARIASTRRAGLGPRGRQRRAPLQQRVRRVEEDPGVEVAPDPTRRRDDARHALDAPALLQAQACASPLAGGFRHQPVDEAGLAPPVRCHEIGQMLQGTLGQPGNDHGFQIGQSLDRTAQGRGPTRHCGNAFRLRRWLHAHNPTYRDRLLPRSQPDDATPHPYRPAAVVAHSTCSMVGAPMASITSRSKPSAMPLASGMSARAARKSSSSG